MDIATTKSLYWYDLETFGIDPKNYRIAQFAGLRTDYDLNPLGTPMTLYCKVADDMLPDPHSCLVTGITPQQANQRGIVESEFIERINDEFTQDNTCVTGYNNIRFDDEFIRYSLYRNFLDPYAREWQHGNSRWDIIDMVRLTYALRPEGINWPQHEDGSPSFKLEDLTQVNNIEHEAAHDAMSDVSATIAIARLVRTKQTKLYDYVFNNRGKQALLQLLNPTQAKAVLHVSAMYPASQACTALVAPITSHPINKNGIIVYDLSVDPTPLLTLDAVEIRKRMFTPTKDLPTGQERIPLKVVHINKSPIVVPHTVLDQASARRTGINTDLCNINRQRLMSHSGLAQKVKDVFTESPFVASSDPDHGLYNGFFNDSDRQKMQRLRKTNAEELAKLNLIFDDRRVPEMLFRFRARNFYQTLSADEKLHWQDYRCEKLLHGDSDSTMTLERYLRELEVLKKEHPEKQQLLTELEAYATDILPQPVVQ